jgi:hypothetical protein
MQGTRTRTTTTYKREAKGTVRRQEGKSVERGVPATTNVELVEKCMFKAWLLDMMISLGS